MLLIRKIPIFKEIRGEMVGPSKLKRTKRESLNFECCLGGGKKKEKQKKKEHVSIVKISFCIQTNSLICCFKEGS